MAVSRVVVVRLAFPEDGPIDFEVNVLVLQIPNVFILSSILHRLLTFLNVDLCPLKRSLNSLFVSPMYVSFDPSLLFVTVAW